MLKREGGKIKHQEFVLNETGFAIVKKAAQS